MKEKMKGIFKNFFKPLESDKFVYLGISFGLILRICALSIFYRFQLVGDELGYHTMAIQLVRGDSFYPYWPPGLPYYLSFFYKVFGQNELAARGSILLLYIVFSYFIYLLVKEIAAKKVANIIVLIFSIYPNYIWHSITPLTDLPTATYLAAITYLAILLYRRKTVFIALALGVISGCAALTRPSSLIFIVLMLVYIFSKTRKKRIAFILFLTVFGIIFAWQFKIHNMTKSFVMINSANSKNIFIGNNPYTPLYKTWWFGSHGRGDDRDNISEGYARMEQEIRKSPLSEQPRLFLQAAVKHILTRPDLFIIRTLNRIRCYFVFDTYFGSFLVKKYHLSKPLGLSIIILDAIFYCSLMIGAILFLFTIKRSFIKFEQVLMIALIILFYSIPYWLSFSHPTYHFPVVPLFAVLFAGFAGKLMDKKDFLKCGYINTLYERRRPLLFTLLFFIYIQAEWIYIMISRI